MRKSYKNLTHVYTIAHTQLCASSSPIMIYFACHNPLIQIRTGIRWWMVCLCWRDRWSKSKADQRPKSKQCQPNTSYGLNGIIKMLILTQWGSPASQEDDCEAFCDLFQAQARRTSAPFSLPLVRKVASLFWSHISRVMLFRKRSSEQIPLILSQVVIGVQCHRQWLQNSLDESPLNLAIAMWRSNGCDRDWDRRDCFP